MNMKSFISYSENKQTNFDMPKTVDMMTNEEFNAKLQHSYKQSLTKQGIEFHTFFNALENSLY